VGAATMATESAFTAEAVRSVMPKPPMGTVGDVKTAVRRVIGTAVVPTRRAVSVPCVVAVFKIALETIVCTKFPRMEAVTPAGQTVEPPTEAHCPKAIAVAIEFTLNITVRPVTAFVTEEVVEVIARAVGPVSVMLTTCSVEVVVVCAVVPNVSPSVVAILLPKRV